MAHESSLGFAWPFTQSLRVAGESSFGFAWPFTHSLRVAYESGLGFAWPFTQSSCGSRVRFGICTAVHPESRDTPFMVQLLQLPS